MVTFSPYPFDARPRRAASALLKEGMSVDLICLSHDETAPRREILHGLDILRLPVARERGSKFAYVRQYGVFILLSAAILALRSLKRRYDLVYVHNMPDILVLSALIPKMLGAKVILDLHDPMPELMMTIFGLEQNSPSVRLISQLEKWSIARANLVLTVNLACKRLFASRSCSEEKIEVVMNSPDGEIFPFRPARAHATARQGRNQHFVVMYHGSAVERNGLDVAVDAFAQVRKTIPTAELRICSPSTPFLECVMKGVRDRGLGEAVRYLGRKRLEDLVPEIETCDVGVIPNHRSAFSEINTPTRIFEYLTLGKPVIAPRTPGIQDYFGEESLLFFEAGNSEDLAQRIEHVARKIDEVSEIAERGQEVYLAHTWDHERQTLVSRLSELFEGRSNDSQYCHLGPQSRRE